MPGEWYGVSKLNLIIKKLSDTYNFFTYFNFPNDCKFKVCEFRHGEIDFMEVLRAGFNSEIYKEFI